MHHILNDDDVMATSNSNHNNHMTLLQPDPGLSDLAIRHVTDAETPAILLGLRQ
jgi:hypothetical protein